MSYKLVYHQYRAFVFDGTIEEFVDEVRNNTAESVYLISTDKEFYFNIILINGELLKVTRGGGIIWERSQKFRSVDIREMSEYVTKDKLKELI